MNNLSFQSILNEAYIPWSRLAGGLLKNLSGLQIEEPLVKEFKKLSDQLGGSVFVFDSLTKTIKVIDWTKMSKQSMEIVLRSSRVRTELLETLTLNNIDITKPAVRSTLTGIYKMFADSYVNSANKIVTKDFTTSKIVSDFLKGLKLSLTDLPIIRKIFKDVHYNYYKQYDDIEREVIKVTNDIVAKKKDVRGTEDGFKKLNQLFEQLVSLDKMEHRILWKELSKKLPKDFANNMGKDGWNNKRYLEFVKYFQGELSKPPKVIFDKIDAALKLNPFKKDFYSKTTFQRLANVLLQWDPRTIEEMKQTIRVYGGAKFAGKTIGDKLIFATVVYPIVTSSLQTVSDILDNKMLKGPYKKGENSNFQKYVETNMNWSNNIVNFFPNTIKNYLNNFGFFAEKLTTIPGWSPLLALANMTDWTKKSDEEKKNIVDQTLKNMKSQEKDLTDSVKKDVEGTKIIEKLKENVPNINLDSLTGVVKSSIQDKPKPKFDSNF
jgi:hypothetical protein